jgi:hypothetical protein
MALKETNKNKTKPAEPVCCGQGCNNHENMKPGIKPVSVDKTCKLDNQIVFGFILIVGGVFLLLNAFIFPLL